MYRFLTFFIISLAISTSCVRLGITDQDTIQTAEEKVVQEVERDLGIIVSPQTPKKVRAPRQKHPSAKSDPKTPLDSKKVA